MTYIDDSDIILFTVKVKALIKNDSLLCVDEGQDISILQYDLMLRVNDNSVRFNIYGDINQRLPSNYNIVDWDTLLKYINAKKIVLNENYANCNSKLKQN